MYFFNKTSSCAMILHSVLISHSALGKKQAFRVFIYWLIRALSLNLMYLKVLLQPYVAPGRG